MSAEENMALARHFIEARVKGDLDTMDEMMALNYVSHTPMLSAQATDRDGCSPKSLPQSLTPAYTSRIR